MKNQKKILSTKIIIGICFILLNSFDYCLYGQQVSKPDEIDFQNIKLLIFDEKWAEALKRLDEFLNQYPSSSLRPLALFFRARSLSQLPGQTEKALAAYEDYLRLKSISPSVAEEAELAIINLAAALVAQGKREYADRIENRLHSSNKVVRYYAAFKLSYFKDKNLAAKSIPVLKEIISQEKDDELRDRARIALLRVAPQELSQIEKKISSEKPLVLKIKVEKKGQKEPEIFISIPWSLADLALRSIPEREKNRLKQQGYDIERVIRDLTQTKGQIIEIKDEDTIIRIWLERE
ncbi:MAG: tetratricopeptide repeat protein [Candidatus Aminicenantes bacterium]|nr:tetratricopeptide repeat protein [Candidatus Aminicenantes bacterium]